MFQRNILPPSSGQRPYRNLVRERNFHRKFKTKFPLPNFLKEKRFFFFNPMPHMSLTDFVVFPPGDGRRVTDF